MRCASLDHQSALWGQWKSKKMWVLTKQIDKVEVIWMLILYGRLCNSKLKSKKIGGLKIKDTQEKSIVIKKNCFKLTELPLKSLNASMYCSSCIFTKISFCLFCDATLYWRRAGLAEGRTHDSTSASDWRNTLKKL